MRFFYNAFLYLIFSTAVLAQISDEKFQFKGRFDFDNPAEKILAYDLFAGGERLRLIGEKSIQIWDVKNNKVLESRPHEIENLSKDHFGGLSPDKSKLIVLGFETSDGGKDSPKIKIPAKIYDAVTGKLITVLDKTDQLVQGAVWSKDGKTLATSSDSRFTYDYGYRYVAAGSEVLGNRVGEIEVSFWDAETMKHRASIAVNNITWRYLSFDGEKLLTTSGPKRNMLGINYASEKAETIDVWNTRTGKLEKQIAIGDDNFFTRTRKMMVSPDGKSLALVLKSRKSDADDRMLVWDIYGNQSPKYTLKANPKIADSELGYSPDGKLVALDSGKNTQFYEIENGAKKFETANLEVPEVWLPGNKIALYNKDDKIRGFEIPSGRQLFEEKVAYQVISRGTGTYSTDSEGNYKEETQSEVVDSTSIVPHPGGKIFLTYSNKSVKIHDAQTGAALRVLVAEPLTFKKKKKILGFPVPVIDLHDLKGNLVSRAEWANDGKMILILDSEKKSISVWEMKE